MIEFVLFLDQEEISSSMLTPLARARQLREQAHTLLKKRPGRLRVFFGAKTVAQNREDALDLLKSAIDACINEASSRVAIEHDELSQKTINLYSFASEACLEAAQISEMQSEQAQLARDACRYLILSQQVDEARDLMKNTIEEKRGTLSLVEDLIESLRPEFRTSYTLNLQFQQALLWGVEYALKGKFRVAGNRLRSELAECEVELNNWKQARRIFSVLCQSSSKWERAEFLYKKALVDLVLEFRDTECETWKERYSDSSSREMEFLQRVQRALESKNVTRFVQELQERDHIKALTPLEMTCFVELKKCRFPDSELPESGLDSRKEGRQLEEYC